jgi:hypothetical protein
VGRVEEMRRRRRARARRRALLGGGIVSAVAVAAAGVLLGVQPLHRHSSGPATLSAEAGRSAPAGAGSGRAARTRAVASATKAGATGAGGLGPPADNPAAGNGLPLIQAASVIQENAKPGTTSWIINHPGPGFIDGFADHTSATAGEQVTLYVTTDAPSFTVRAYRMGWYGGAGARLVWTSAPASGVDQPPCPVQAVTNMVSCDNWTPSLRLTVSPAFVPGDYLLELVGSAGQESYVPLTVTDPSSHAAYLVENDIYTWQAWNPWGGYDFYQGVGACHPTYPVCNRARVVSFDRPYGYGEGAADFLTNEYPLVRLMEKEGLDVTYTTSADIEADPGMLLQHRALLSLGHDECWSYHERLAAQQAESAGVNVVFFGASAMLRHVRLEASPLGPRRQEVDYRDSAEDPMDRTGPAVEVTGNTWSDPPASWSEVPFVGEEYTGYVEPGQKAVPMVVLRAHSWLFAGTGLESGQSLPGLLVSDFDQVDPNQAPADEEILAHSPMPMREVQTNVRDPASDVAYWTDARSGAGVFDTGTVAWIPDLASSPVVAKMTTNLLAVFGAGPVGLHFASVGNSRQVYGY